MNQSFEGLTPDLTEVFLLLDLVGIASSDNRAAVMAHVNTKRLVRALNILHQEKILNQENFNAVIAHSHPSTLADIMCDLHQAGILNAKNIAAIIKITVLDELNLMLYELVKDEILNQEIFNAVITHANPSILSKMLRDLKSAGISYSEDCNMLLTHRNPDYLARAFIHLHEAGILIPAHKAMVIKHPKSVNLARAFCELHRAGILNPENTALFIKNPDPFELSVSFCELHRIGILNPAHKAMLISNPDPFNLARAFINLHRAGMLNPEHRAMVIAHPNPFNLAGALWALHQVGMLNSVHKTMLLSHPDPVNLTIALFHLSKVGLLTGENRKLAVTSSSHRLTIPCAVTDIDRTVFSEHLSNVDSILILTSKRAEYERISALIPEQFHRFIQPIALFALIKEAQLKALNDVDVLSLDKTRLPDYAISLVHEYVRPFNDLISQLPLPFEDDELPGYLSNLHRVLEQYKQQQLALGVVIDKLHKLITGAEEAISTARRRTSLFNLAMLDKKHAQVNAIEKLTRWLGDDELRLSAEEIALLAASRSVRLILENNPLHLAKLSELKGELWRHEQERLSLSQQRFLFRFFPENPHSSRQAFDRQYGMVLYRG
ncbi:MAG: hypothetical protein EBY16_03885 [Gammaproteobacteria bacterium]|nr:hypothetical protein [Gammaproteobacteria bacterium]